MESRLDIGFYFLNLVYCLTVFLANAGEDYPGFSHPVASSDNGRTQLNQIQDYSRHPHYGQCWTSALARLHEGCKQLTEEEQGRMALSFANCHLEKAGFTTYHCTEDQNLTTCLQQMKGNIIAFNAYTEFFTHTQDICFFLQSQVWHERTENTVSRLAQSSEDVAEQLDFSSKLQEEMIQKQSSSLEQQEEIIKNGAYLKEALKSSTKDMKDVFAEVKQNTENQRAQLDATFDRVTQIQRVILGEFTWFNSFFFFAGAILICYLVTSTPRTSGARLIMFGVLAVDCCVERMIFSASDKNDQELLYYRMWICRQVFCFIAALVLIIIAYRYKDLAHLNYQLLLDIKRQNSELRHKLDHPSLMSALKVSSQPMLAMGAPMHAIRHHQRLQLAQDSVDSPEPLALGGIYSSDEGVYSDNEDRTYRPELTYLPEQDNDTESVESFITADPSSRVGSRQPSRVATPTPNNISAESTSTTSNETELGSSGLLNTSIFNASAFMAPATGDSSTSSTKRKRGRPKGSRNRSSRESTPMDRSFTPSYNLRTRRNVYSPNPLLDVEDVRTFVKHVEAFQERNFMVHSVESVRSPSTTNRTVRRKARGSTSAATPGFFSSDDEM
ncbi:uncharacterized protein [Amphiura filiformis]|uniref:uncharacterized protein n=1 Tax=Amphiura filiformis TaxID=82378 RepID=UPI003B212D1F